MKKQDSLSKKTRISWCVFGSILFGFFASVGVMGAIKTEDSTVFANSLLSLAVWAVSGMILYMAFQLANRRAILFASIVGLLYAIMDVLGKSLYTTFALPPLTGKLFIKCIGLASLMGGSILLFLLFLPVLRAKLSVWGKDWRVTSIFTPGKRYIIWTAVLLLVCWAPLYIASFPGVFAYDMPNQVSELDQGIMESKQPILTSIVCYTAMRFGQVVFGSYNIGLAIFIIGQMLIGSWVIAYCCNFMSRRGVPWIFQLLAIFYYALLPLIPMLMVNATKDVLWSISVLLFVVITWDMVLDPKRFFSSPWLLLRFCAVALWMEFYRNNGIYIFLLLIPALLLLLWKKGKEGMKRKCIVRVLAMAALCVVPYYLITGPVYRKLEISPSPIVEMLAIPEQQLAAAYWKNGDQFTEEEKQFISDLFPNGLLQQYNPRNSDLIRVFMNGDKVKKQPLEFLSYYLHIGLKCPRAYLEGMLNNTIGYWYPNINYPDKTTRIAYIEYQNSDYPTTIMTDRYMIAPKISDFYQNIVNGDVRGAGIEATEQGNGGYTKIPGFSMLFSIGFTSWLLLLAAIAFWYLREYRALIPIWILFGVWLTSFAGPFVILRYVFPIFLAFPLIWGMLISCANQDDSPLKNKGLRCFSKKKRAIESSGSATYEELIL